MPEQITVTTVVHAPLTTVWARWTNPTHITQWAFASDDWEAPTAENDLRVGGAFTTRMQAKDGSAGFDLVGIYTEVEPHKRIAYVMEDGRAVRVLFDAQPDGIHITESFDPEQENTREMQRSGWQAILDRFRAYVESA